MLKSFTANDIVDFLNRIHDVDPDFIQALSRFSIRIDARLGRSDLPLVSQSFDEETGDGDIGFLGIINGLLLSKAGEDERVGWVINSATKRVEYLDVVAYGTAIGRDAAERVSAFRKALEGRESVETPEVRVAGAYKVVLTPACVAFYDPETGESVVYLHEDLDVSEDILLNPFAPLRPGTYGHEKLCILADEWVLHGEDEELLLFTAEAAKTAEQYAAMLTRESARPEYAERRATLSARDFRYLMHRAVSLRLREARVRQRAALQLEMLQSYMSETSVFDLLMGTEEA